jgi:hypothetical protein
MEPEDTGELGSATSDSMQLNNALSVLLESHKEMSKNMSELASSIK